MSLEMNCVFGVGLETKQQLENLVEKYKTNGVIKKYQIGFNNKDWMFFCYDISIVAKVQDFRGDLMVMTSSKKFFLY